MTISNRIEKQHTVSLQGLIYAAMDQNGRRECILAPGLPALSFRGLFDHLRYVESELRAAGIGPGDCVASALSNGADAASAFFAFASSCLYAPLSRDDDANAYDVALEKLNPAAMVLKSGDLTPARAAAERAGIRVIELETPPGYKAGGFELTMPRIGPAPRAAKQPEGSGAFDLCPGLLMQTSGTTGYPKFVRHTHHSLCQAAEVLIRAHRLSPADRCLNVSPLHHSLGLVGSILIAILSGGSVVCTAGFAPDEFFRCVEEFSPTWFSAVPPILLAIGTSAANHQELLRRHPIRFARSAGARLSPEARRKIEEELCAPVIQAFGMSECPPITVDPLPPALRKVHSVGVVSGPEVAIWDDSGAALGLNVTGRLVIRGGNLMAGYYNDASANAAAFSGGWFITGDCGYLDDDGYVFLTGRLSEFINRGGEKVAPSEVEDVFGSHPDVAQAVTFAVPDDRLGEEVATAIVPRHEAALTVEQLRRFAATRLAFHKFPKRIYLVSEIPLGRTGKPDRAALRARFERDTAQPGAKEIRHVAPRTDLENQIAAVWCDVLDLPRAGVHDNFFDSGGDSLAAARLVARLASALGNDALGTGMLIAAPTIAELALLLAKPERDRVPVLPLQPAGNDTPLFWIDGFAAVSVLEGLDGNRPVFLVPLPGPPNQDAGQLIAYCVEVCLRRMRQFRPHGPYLLAGWCAAGVIALEMARILRAEGEKVDLVLFDVRGVLRRDSTLLQSRWISAVRGMQKLQYHFKKLTRLEAPTALRYVADRMKTQSNRIQRGLLKRRRQWLSASGGDLPVSPQSDDLLYLTAIRSYRGKPYSGRIVHIWAKDRPRGRFRNLEYEWGPIGKGCQELYEAAGNHVSMFQGTNGIALGQLLNHCLNRIEQENSPASNRIEDASGGMASDLSNLGAHLASTVNS